MLNRICSIVLLIILSPFILLIALAIKIDSTGPVFFKQRRVGQYDKYFIIYKFRTMTTDMPDLPSDKVGKNDNRYTKLGKILRRLSLDEIPQLINIIKGDMNFVGPRPALYNQDDLIAMRTEVGVQRLKPGVTGWAQVNGRDNILLERKVELDRYYLENRSLSLDFKILWLTLVKSLGGVDLYKQDTGITNEQREKYQSPL